MFQGKKVIVFDMDGTLIDSVGIWNEVDKNLIKKLGASQIPMEEEIQEQRDTFLRIHSKAENPYLEYGKSLGEKYHSPLRPDEILQLRYEIAKEYLINAIDYKPNADKLIRKLKEKGFILSIASTTRRPNMDIYKTKNQNIRNKANLEDYFSCIFTREDVQEIKPNPEVFLKVAKELGVQKEECLIFEDSLVGVEAAKSAGIEVVAVYDKYSDKERDQINQLSNNQISTYAEAIQMLDCMK